MNLSPPSNNLSMASSYHHSHHQETSPPGTASTGTTAPAPLSLSRYDSAPGSFLSNLVSSSAAPAAPPTIPPFGRFFPGESSSSSPSLTLDTTCKVNPADQRLQYASDNQTGMDPNPLVRHSSSPAGFFSNLLMDNYAGNCSRGGTEGMHATSNNNRQLKSQLSFTRQSTLSQISEDDIPDLRESMGGGFSLGSWDETNSIVFSPPTSKRGKDNNGDIIAGLGNMDSQFGLPRASMEMDKYHQIQQDQVPFKVRAKRGCATHPRSIAERERRTRISEKLRKLQDLVPNMDKQTSTSDMLDLAVQHIRGLQKQIHILNEEQENCTCGSKRRNET